MTNNVRPYHDMIQRLRGVGLRPTTQRLAIAKIMFESKEQHYTAESLHQKARDEGYCIAIATVYNTLNQFTAAGLVRELVVESGKSYFDTRLENHCHFYCETTGQLIDIPQCGSTMVTLPDVPEGRNVRCVDVIIRLSPDSIK